MNDLIAQVLHSEKYVERIRQKLPPAFEMVDQQAKGPEAGVLREAVIIGMFMAFLGEEQVEPNANAVGADVDCYLNGIPLSIKTLTGANMGGIRIKWTSDQAKAKEFINSFQPICDLLIVRIIWQRDGGRISYVPKEAQRKVFGELGKCGYLDYRQGTNTRGINLSKDALAALEGSQQSIVIPLEWYRSVQPQSRYDKWVSYWEND